MILETYTIKPGGSFGWHAHGAPVAVVVTAGTLTVFDPTRQRVCAVQGRQGAVVRRAGEPRPSRAQRRHEAGEGLRALPRRPEAERHVHPESRARRLQRLSPDEGRSPGLLLKAQRARPLQKKADRRPVCAQPSMYSARASVTPGQLSQGVSRLEVLRDSLDRLAGRLHGVRNHLLQWSDTVHPARVSHRPERAARWCQCCDGARGAFAQERLNGAYSVEGTDRGGRVCAGAAVGYAGEMCGGRRLRWALLGDACFFSACSAGRDRS